MKDLTILFFFLIGIGSLVGCKAQYKSVSAVETPCVTRDTGVNVRLENIGKINFSAFSIYLGDEEYKFGGLKPKKKTCYQNLPYLLARGVDCRIVFELVRPSEGKRNTRLSGFISVEEGVYKERDDKLNARFVTIQVEPYFRNNKRMDFKIRYRE